jgi:hypothetical protein
MIAKGAAYQSTLYAIMLPTPDPPIEAEPIDNRASLRARDYREESRKKADWLDGEDRA